MISKNKQYCVLTMDPNGKGEWKPISWTIGKPLEACRLMSGEGNLNQTRLKYRVGARDVGQWEPMES